MDESAPLNPDLFQTEEFIQRFWKKVETIPFHECWEWIGDRNPQGYGSIQVTENGQRRRTIASRVSYLLANGEWPDLCLHHCDNPSCIRPDHLYSGTQKDNIQDAVRRGRHNRMNPKGRERIRGRKNPNARLTAEQVWEIAAAYRPWLSDPNRQRVRRGLVKELAEKFGVSDGTIQRIGIHGYR